MQKSRLRWFGLVQSGHTDWRMLRLELQGNTTWGRLKEVHRCSNEGINVVAVKEDSEGRVWWMPTICCSQMAKTLKSSFLKGAIHFDLGWMYLRLTFDYSVLELVLWHLITFIVPSKCVYLCNCITYFAQKKS